mgnify:CR=1 FL=1
MKEQFIENFEENLKNYFSGDLEDLTEFDLIGLITKYEVNFEIFLKFYSFFYLRYLITNYLI